jgi:hypothetical protein
MNNECIECGVAFDVNKDYCMEKDCTAVKAAERKVSKQQKSKKYYIDNKQKVDPIYARLTSCKTRAKKKQFGFDLDIDFIKKVLELPCIYCGNEGGIQLDRKDNLLGYLKSNVIPACKRCNTVKSMYLSYDEMLIVAKALKWCA